jgi:hypothetical protein
VCFCLHYKYNTYSIDTQLFIVYFNSANGFILSYLKNNPLQQYHGATYGMTQPQCNEWVHRLSDILLKTLKTLGELPDRNHLRVQYFLDKCEDVLLDGTERPIERPQDEYKQKSCYSGKQNS